MTARALDIGTTSDCLGLLTASVLEYSEASEAEAKGDESRWLRNGSCAKRKVNSGIRGVEPIRLAEIDGESIVGKRNVCVVQASYVREGTEGRAD